MSESAVPGAPSITFRRALLIGAAAGLLSGLFGVGGGILVVPGLVLLAGMAQRLAHGTSLAAIVPIALAGVVGYALSSEVDVVAGAWITVGAVVGAVVGTSLLRRASAGVLRLGFAALLLVAAVRMVMDAGAATGRPATTAASALALVGVGLASGVLAGLFGVGGGTVLVPAMVVLFGMPAALAKGTSLLVIIPTSLVGTARNLRHGQTDLRVAAVVGVSGVVTAFVGARLSIGLSERTAAVLFAGLLVVLAVRMIVEELRSPP